MVVMEESYSVIETRYDFLNVLSVLGIEGVDPWSHCSAKSLDGENDVGVTCEESVYLLKSLCGRFLVGLRLMQIRGVQHRGVGDRDSHGHSSTGQLVRASGLLDLLLDGVELGLELVNGGVLGVVGGKISHRVELALYRG